MCRVYGYLPVCPDVVAAALCLLCVCVCVATVYLFSVLVKCAIIDIFKRTESNLFQSSFFLPKCTGKFVFFC